MVAILVIWELQFTGGVGLGFSFGGDLAKTKHVSAMMRHLIADTNWRGRITNGTKFQCVKSNF